MRVMTFNIQHGKNFLTGKIDLDGVVNAIRRHGGELVCLNEVYGKGLHPAFTAQTDRIADALGYTGYFARAISIGGMGPYGNAFLSAFPILEAQTVPVPSVPRNHPGYFEDRCAFRAVVNTDCGKITVIGCHFGLQPEEQVECVKTVCELIDRERNPVVLMGDFNVTPENKVLTPIRERLKDTADFDCGNAFTFPSDRPQEKIDYIFVSSSLKVTGVTVPCDVVSDHLPIIADICPG